MMKNNPHKNPLIKNAAPERAVDIVERELSLARLAIVSKSFEHIHTTGYQYDQAAILDALQETTEVAEPQPDNVVELRPKTGHESLSQEALRHALGTQHYEQGDIYGQRAS